MKRNSDFQKFNVFRRPDWRMERVLQIIERPGNPGRCSARDDEFIRAARSFVLKWRARESMEEREELFFENSPLFYAYCIYERFEDEPEPALLIQARLLARQSHEEIAKCLSTLPETIDWYEKLFFNVSDRLENRDWITKHVLLPSIMRNHGVTHAKHEDNPSAFLFRDTTIAHSFMDASLKLFAYFGGPHVVDIMITGFQSGKPVSSPEDLTKWFDQNWATAIRRRSHQAALQFDINKYNVMDLFNVHTQIMSLEQSADAKEQNRTRVERYIQAMLDDLPFAVGDKAAEAVQNSPIGKWDNEAVELRDDELLRVGHGEELGIEVLKKLPPPRKQKMALDKGKKDD